MVRVADLDRTGISPMRKLQSAGDHSNPSAELKNARFLGGQAPSSRQWAHHDASSRSRRRSVGRIDIRRSSQCKAMRCNDGVSPHRHEPTTVSNFKTSTRTTSTTSECPCQAWRPCECTALSLACELVPIEPNAFVWTRPPFGESLHAPSGMPPKVQCIILESHRHCNQRPGR